jgi:hypothetical protein
MSMALHRQSRRVRVLANPDLATCLAPGAVTMSSPFGIMTLDVSVLAVWVATTVYSTVSVSSPISDSSTLPTHIPLIECINRVSLTFPSVRESDPRIFPYLPDLDPRRSDN